MTAAAIMDKLESAGLRAAFLPYSRIETVKKHYDELAEKNGNTDHTKDAVKHFYNNQPPDLPFTPLSFLIIAQPSDPGQVIFRTNGKSVAVPVPPTYLGYVSENEKLNSILESAAKGYQTARSKGMSQKLLAVYSGLGRYGRNNICYIEGFGSYFSIHAYYTDIPCDDISHPLRFLDECETCGLCRQNCPTGAIGEYNVIDCARCLTMLNERKDPMPDWLSPKVHHTLIGCLRCQEICPKNMALPVMTVHTLELDEDETRALLSTDSAELQPELEHKLKSFGMHEYFLSVIGRNAKLVLQNT